MTPIGKEKNLVEKVTEHPEVREMFKGRRTVFSATGVIVGGVLFANGVWFYLDTYLPVWGIMIVGIVLFGLAGIVSKSFQR